MAEDLWGIAAQSVGAESPDKKTDLWQLAAKEMGIEQQPAQNWQSRARDYTQRMKTDPAFRALPPAERMKTVFPDAEKEDRPVVTPRPARGFFGAMEEEAAAGERAMAEGIEEIARPKSYLRSLTGLPVLNVVGGAAQRLFSPATAFYSEYVSRPLGNVARELPVPDPETLGQQVEGMSDVAAPMAAAKGAQLLKAPLAKTLPTRPERLGALEQEKNARLAQNEIMRERRLSDVEAAANRAQIRQVGSQARRETAFPAQKSAIEQRAAADIATERASLAAQQQKVGKEAAEAAAPAGPKRANFEKRYRDLELAGEKVYTTPVNLNAAASRVSREGGLPVLPTHPERTARGVNQVLTESSMPEIEEEIASRVRRLLTEGAEAKKIDYDAITREIIGPATSDQVTVGQLSKTRKRLREAERVAYERDHKNIARQWGVLEDAITEDIKKADPRLARISAKLDRDYFKKKASEWYAQGVDQAFNPATGLWERKRFTKWWEQHADSTNNDKDLRRLLGDRYDQTKGLVEDMQRANEMNIEKASQEAIRNIKRRMGGELRELGQKEKDIAKLSRGAEAEIFEAQTGAAKGIEKETSGQAKAIEKEIADKMLEITGRPYTGRFHELYAMGSIILGTGSAVGGTLTGNPALAYGGVATAGGGAFILMTHDALLKMVNTARGTSLLRRAVRAAPGTGEAISAGAAIANFAKQLQSEQPEELDMRDSREKPQIKNPDGSVSSSREIAPRSSKESFLKKYGIQ